IKPTNILLLMLASLNERRLDDEGHALGGEDDGQGTAFSRSSHSPASYSDWAVDVPGRCMAWHAEWHFRDWAFPCHCWRLVVCVGLAFSPPSKLEPSISAIR